MVFYTPWQQHVSVGLISENKSIYINIDASSNMIHIYSVYGLCVSGHCGHWFMATWYMVFASTCGNSLNFPGVNSLTQNVLFYYKYIYYDIAKQNDMYYIFFPPCLIWEKERRWGMIGSLHHLQCDTIPINDLLPCVSTQKHEEKSFN